MNETELTDLEMAAIKAIIEENPSQKAALEVQLKLAAVTTRENTGSGFYTDMRVPDDAPKANGPGTLGESAFAKIIGLDYELGFLLFLENGSMSLLEGYYVGPEDTKSLDFRAVEFEMLKPPFTET